MARHVVEIAVVMDGAVVMVISWKGLGVARRRLSLEVHAVTRSQRFPLDEDRSVMEPSAVILSKVAPSLGGLGMASP